MTDRRWHGGPFDGADVRTGENPEEGETVNAPTRMRIGTRWATVSHRYEWKADGWHYFQSDFDEWKEGMQFVPEEVTVMPTTGEEFKQEWPSV